MRVDPSKVFIDNQADLDDLMADAIGAPWVSVDTEFERIRTFFPRLCLIQMATPQWTVCIDPLADITLSGVGALLASAEPVKIFHAARQDMEVLQHTLGILPGTLFDTQIAAALAGFGEQVGYARLVKEICDVELSKAYTRTAWCRRPLIDVEIRYALDDAHYLGDLYQHLKTLLDQRGRTAWATEDFSLLACGDVIEAGAASAVKRILRACSSFDREGQSVAHALALWREEAARRLDRPREWLLALDVIVEIARSRPQNLTQLEQLPGVESGTVKRRGQAILEVVERAHSEAVNYTPLQKPGRVDPAIKALGNRMWSYLSALCAEADLPTASVARRDDIRRLAFGERDLPLLKGWRRQFAGEALLEISTQTDE